MISLKSILSSPFKGERGGLRLLHRHGYGIQSPWLFTLVTEVIPAKEEYYAYTSLPPVEGWRTRDLRLLLRLANHFQPSEIQVINLPAHLSQWLSAGCRKALIKITSDVSIPRIHMTRPDGSQCLITPALLSPLWQQTATSPDAITLETRRLGLSYSGLNIPSQHFKI